MYLTNGSAGAHMGAAEGDMVTKSRFIISFIILALVVCAIAVALDVLIPGDDWVSQLWHAPAAVIPASVVYVYLATRRMGRERPAEAGSRLKAGLLDAAADSSPLYDTEGNLVRAEHGSVVSAVGDITASRRMERTLNTAYEELERVFNAAADAMRVVDADFNVLRVNDAHAVLSGMNAHEAVARKCFESFRGPLCDTAECPVRRILNGDEFAECEIEKERDDGTTARFVVGAGPLRGPEGTPVGILESFKDVTELRKTQEQLQQSQLLASLGEMTAGIAHEVNNPLGSVLLYSELLMAGDDTSPQAKRDLRVIHDEAKRATRIMTDLLIYCRRGRFQLRRLDMHRILRKVARMRQYAESVRNITLSTDLAEGPLYVRGDSSQLNRLLMNLVLNAEEALKEPGGGNIVITTRKKGNWARVSVADDGGGIDPRKLKQVFYPFYATKDVGEGTGLGLSTCHGIVTDHKGLIRAENNQLGGATFIVELPLATDGADCDPPAEAEVTSEAIV